MDLLEGLKYGAIGLCVILFIISTRLLSKEQNRESIRMPVLNMIKIFLGAAVFLSLFFGLTELLTPENTDDKLATLVDDIWSNHKNKSVNDTSLSLKIARIKTIQKNQPVDFSIDTLSTCAAISEELEKSQDELKKMNQNFYSNIARLKKIIDQRGESINIDYDPASKTTLYETLEEIFIKLDLVETATNDHQVIRNKWKAIKKKWSPSNHKFIFYSDLPQLVRQYLDKFHPKNEQ